MSEFKPGALAVIIKDGDCPSNLGKWCTLIEQSFAEEVVFRDSKGHPWHIKNPNKESVWVIESSTEMDIMVLDDDDKFLCIDKDTINAVEQSSLRIISGYKPDDEELKEIARPKFGVRYPVVDIDSIVRVS